MESTVDSEYRSEHAYGEEQSPAPASDSLEGYVLQVGAFSSRASAAKAERQIDSPELKVMATRRNYEDWYVLVLGTYPGKSEAQEAGRAYLQRYPNGSVWVRVAADFNETLLDR